MTSCTALLRTLLVAALSLNGFATPEQIHNTVGAAGALKVFVEPGGSFSPGLGTFGVAFRMSNFMAVAGSFTPEPRSPSGTGSSVWWVEEQRGALLLRTEVCGVKRATLQGDAFVLAARARLTNTSGEAVSTTLSVSIAPEGPAGGPIHALAFARHAFSIEGHPVLIAQSASTGAILASGAFEPRPFLPQAEAAVTSEAGECRGEMLFDVKVPAKGSVTLGFLCPVLAGRIAGEGGPLQPDPGLEFYRGLNVDDIFAEAEGPAGGKAK